MTELIAILQDNATGYVADVIILEKVPTSRTPDALGKIRAEILSHLSDPDDYRVVFRNATRGKSYPFGFTLS
jgi:hypothetical protein